MKLGITSDLHLEFSGTTFSNPEDVDVLLLAGDILVTKGLNSELSPYYKVFVDFLDYVSTTFPVTYLVMGNHEHYRGVLNTTELKLKEFLSRYDNIYLLENELIVLDYNLKLFGCTLWSDYDKSNPNTMYLAESSMNDYKVIHYLYNNKYVKLKPYIILDIHKESLKQINNCVKSNDNLIIMTHHSPCQLSIGQEFVTNSLNGAYYSDLSEIILDNPNIKLWVHGHTHNQSDYYLGNTRVICNPRGYDESGKTTELKIIEI